MNELIKGKRKITLQRDYLLHTVLGTPVKYWILLQIDYDYEQFLATLPPSDATSPALEAALPTDDDTFTNDTFTNDDTFDVPPQPNNDTFTNDDTFTNTDTLTPELIREKEQIFRDF